MCRVVCKLIFIFQFGKSLSHSRHCYLKEAAFCISSHARKLIAQSKAYETKTKVRFRGLLVSNNLSMAGHVSAPVQEHCTVCGFSEPTVFTKTVWTKFSTVRYWPSCCMQVLHGQASVLQQTSANLIGSPTDVENCIVAGN